MTTVRVEALLESIYDDVYDMNVYGIVLMQQAGSLADAAIVLTKALTTLRNSKRMKASSCAEGREMKLVQISSARYKEQEEDARVVYSLALPSNEKVDDNNDVFVPFRRALNVASDAKEVTGDLGLCHDILSGVIIYNLGIVHHLTGLQTASSKALSTGLELYLMAYNMMRQTSLEHSAGTGVLPILTVGFLATSNNIGHIYAIQGSLGKASVCSDELAMRLAPLPESPICVSTEECEIFLLNVCFFNLNSFATAASA
jgi:hypothetical protein